MKICGLVKRRSIWIASIASCTLRWNERSGEEKKIARQLHGQRGCALHFAAGFDIAIGRSNDAPEIDSRMTVEIFVFDGNQRIPQDRGKIVVACDHPALQRKRADHAVVIVI